MASSKENISVIKRYYEMADSAYNNWGPDPERIGIYAIHLGYVEKPQLLSKNKVFDNHTAVKQLTEKVVTLADVHDDQYVLDSGCGTGSISYEIASKHPKTKVVGINIVSPQLQVAGKFKNCEGINNISFSRQDFHTTSFEAATFDRVIFCESLAHSHNKQSLVREAARILKDGGKVVIADCFKSTNDFTEEEMVFLDNFRLGMGVPNMVLYKDFLDYLKMYGFENIKSIDITENILPSAIFASKHAEMRLMQQPNSPEIQNKGRLAMIGIERLLSRGKANYYFLTAEK